MPRLIAPLLTLLFLAACSVPGPGEAPDGVHDPYEAVNRPIHTVNVGLDTVALRPASQVYGALPGPVRQGVSNVADTLGTPASVVNQILQGEFTRAGKNTLRFTTNAVLGIGGLLDPATDLGLPRDEADFGETLHVWGAAEGAYIVLPVLGPSNERDAVGTVVDFVIDPLDSLVIDDVVTTRRTTRILDVINERGELSDTIDDVLYESADSYRQLRLISTQRRRFELGDTGPEAQPGGGGQEVDPFALDTEGF